MIQVNTLNKVFVYGTLKSGGALRGIDTLSDQSVLIGKATTEYPDYDMLDLGAFPGVVSGTKFIQGEVWEVDEDTFHILDHIEGYPNFYNRKMVHTTEGKAWMYYLNNETDYYGSTTSDQSDRIEKANETLIWSNR